MVVIVLAQMNAVLEQLGNAETRSGLHALALVLTLAIILKVVG